MTVLELVDEVSGAIRRNSDVIAIIGGIGTFLTAIRGFVVWRENEKMKRENERKRTQLEAQMAYLETNNTYLDYLRLALEYPHLDPADYPLEGNPRPLTAEENLQQKILFSILTSVLERTYYFARSPAGADSAFEWATWDNWVSMWFDKPAYRAFWEGDLSGVFSKTEQWAADFEAYMEKKYCESKSNLTSAGQPTVALPL